VGGPTGSTLTLASFNVHMGVDGWGRPFDVVSECRDLDADVLVMQESWAPDDGSPSTAGQVATALGYQVVAEVGLAHARRYAALDTGSERWAPRPRQLRKALVLDGEGWPSTGTQRGRPFVPGQWGVALLARIPFGDTVVLPLGQLRRDSARRCVIGTTVELGTGEVTVLGTHMSHITHGSHGQYRRLRQLLPPHDRAGVLAGDMNLWGPPVNAYVPTWRRAVVGRTWPSHRPHSQLDHILVTPAVSVVTARVATRSGSDHRPVVATLGRTRPGRSG
jgi:endonuclease/exonuclease/phosphatase family metal-dependent hydrolase